MQGAAHPPQRCRGAEVQRCRGWQRKFDCLHLCCENSALFCVLRALHAFHAFHAFHASGETRPWRARDHPHPNPLPHAGEGVTHCALSRTRERAGVRAVDQLSSSVSRRTPSANRRPGCSQRTNDSLLRNRPGRSLRFCSGLKARSKPALRQAQGAREILRQHPVEARTRRSALRWWVRSLKRATCADSKTLWL